MPPSIRLLCLLLGAASLLVPLRSHAQIEGKYIGIYAFYRTSFMPAELVLEKRKKEFVGVITFSHFELGVGNTVERSSFAVRTPYDTDVKTVRLIFVNWIDAPTYADFDLGPRPGRLETNGQTLTGDGFEFTLEGSPEAERAVRQREVFEAQAFAQRKADDDYKKRSGSYEQDREAEIARAAERAQEPVDKRRRRGEAPGAAAEQPARTPPAFTRQTTPLPAPVPAPATPAANPQPQPAQTADAYAVGESIEVQWSGTWYKAKILEHKENRYRIRYAGYDSSWDEWVTMARMRRR